jgi:hypothetical protein
MSVPQSELNDCETEFDTEERGDITPVHRIGQEYLRRRLKIGDCGRGEFTPPL